MDGGFFRSKAGQNTRTQIKCRRLASTSPHLPTAYIDTDQEEYNVDPNKFIPDTNPRFFLPKRTIVLENRTPQLTPILNEELIGLHARFSKSLAWMETKVHMNVSSKNITSKVEDLSSLIGDL